MKQDYDWYYPDQQQPPPPVRRRRNKIDRSVNLHIDGEPMNDLEVIAAKNAAKNQRQSKIVFTGETTPHLARETQAPPLKQKPQAPQALQSQALQSQAPPPPSLQEPREQLQSRNSPNDLSFIDEDDESEDVSRPKKKKRWPFSYLFRPIKASVSTPPTPVLSPDYGSTLSSPFEEDEEGYWAFKYPASVPVTPPIWIKFDLENQKRISDHVKSTRLDGIQFTDSHILNGNLPIVVIPSQLCCFVMVDMATNQLSRLELTFLK